MRKLSISIVLVLFLAGGDPALAVFRPLLRRQLHHWNITTDVGEYCQNLQRFITVEYSNQNGGGYSCNCGVNDVGYGMEFRFYCTMIEDSCYVLPGSYEPGPRVSIYFSSKINTEGKESFTKCIDIKGYNTMDVRVSDDTEVEICIESSTTNAAHENATCSAKVGGVTCNSCEVIPCLYFSRPEFLLDCSNSIVTRGAAGIVDTCRKTGKTGTPFVFWEPEQYGVDNDNNGPVFGRCARSETNADFKMTIIVLLMLLAYTF